MSLRQLLPILDIVGTANKHLARVAKFMQKYGDMELFPVKLQVLTQALSCLPRGFPHHDGISSVLASEYVASWPALHPLSSAQAHLRMSQAVVAGSSCDITPMKATCRCPCSLPFMPS